MDLATVDKLLTTTRSVRKRLDLERSVPPEIIEECLEIAIQAPTGGNSQRLALPGCHRRRKKGADWRVIQTIIFYLRPVEPGAGRKPGQPGP